MNKQLLLDTILKVDANSLSRKHLVYSAIETEIFIILKKMDIYMDVVIPNIIYYTKVMKNPNVDIITLMVAVDLRGQCRTFVNNASVIMNKIILYKYLNTTGCNNIDEELIKDLNEYNLDEQYIKLLHIDYAFFSPYHKY